MEYTEQNRKKFEKGVQNLIRIFHQLNIPVADYDKINGIVYNPRLRRVVAKCRYTATKTIRGRRTVAFHKHEECGFTIEISTRFLNLSEKEQIDVLAHELLHTITNSIGHDAVFKKYMNIANATGYFNITVYADADNPDNYNYIIECENCGNTFGYYRMCGVIEHPERYRCKCGSSKLVRIK